MVLAKGYGIIHEILRYARLEMKGCWVYFGWECFQPLQWAFGTQPVIYLWANQLPLENLQRRAVFIPLVDTEDYPVERSREARMP
jgi:hypothetical protein